jgi:hypothetical protein
MTCSSTTHTECIVVFPFQKLLRKCATILCHAYIAYFGNNEFIESFVTQYCRGFDISSTTTTFSDFHSTYCANTALLICVVMLTYGWLPLLRKKIMPPSFWLERLCNLLGHIPRKNVRIRFLFFPLFEVQLGFFFSLKTSWLETYEILKQ